jgi:hypothetical protein
LLAVAISLMLPARGTAGTYTVSACRAGWTPETRLTPNAPAPGAYDFCDLPQHGLSAEFPNNGMMIASGDYAGWRFDAPADTAIASATVRWVGLGDYATASWGASAGRLDMSTTPSPLSHYGRSTRPTP